MAEYGLTTLGIELWAAITPNGDKITDGSQYSRMTRITEIGEMSLEANNIDVSAIEDYVSHYKAGRSDVSDTYSISYLPTNETNAEWRALLGKKVCFLTKIPDLDEQIFVVAEVPKKLPGPAIGQNEAFTSTINCTTNDFIGFDEAVEDLGGGGGGGTTSITLDKTTASVDVSDTTTIIATTVPADQAVTWTSSDEDVATVSGGVVTGVAAGTATITATSGTKTATCTVTVTSI